MEWSGVEWSGVEWSGVEWSGVEWSGASGVEWILNSFKQTFYLVHKKHSNEFLHSQQKKMQRNKNYPLFITFGEAMIR